jgi:hypothetical protein
LKENHQLDESQEINTKWHIIITINIEAQLDNRIPFIDLVKWTSQ